MTRRIQVPYARRISTTRSTARRTCWNEAMCAIASRPMAEWLHGRPANPEPKVRATKRAGIISAICPREGWLYLAVILNPHSWRVIALRVLHAKACMVTAWTVSNWIKRAPAIRALMMANRERGPCGRHLFYGDRPSHGLQANHCWARGSQYCSHDCQTVLARAWLEASDKRHRQLP